MSRLSAAGADKAPLVTDSDDTPAELFVALVDEMWSRLLLLVEQGHIDGEGRDALTGRLLEIETAGRRLIH